MLTRPFYKKVLDLFGVRKAEASEASKAFTLRSETNSSIRHIPLSPPKEQVVKVRRGRKGTKGAFGKCRYVIDGVSNDPRFNHTLRRFERKQ